MSPFPTTGCGPPFCCGPPSSCLFNLLEVLGLGIGGTAPPPPGFLLIRGLGGRGLSNLLLSTPTTPFLGMATWSGEEVGDRETLNISGMDTLLPVAGAATEGSTTLLSMTELVRESYLSCTEVRRLQVT